MFDLIDNGGITAVTSPVTLAECLIAPYRLGATILQNDFSELILSAANTLFVPTGAEIGRQAARLRSRYNISLADSLQLATALSVPCEGFLTNDASLKRLTELTVIVLEDFLQL